MIIKPAKPIAVAAIMVILLVVGTVVVVDAQGNDEAEFTLRGIKTNNPTTFGDKEMLNQLKAARLLSREDYCKMYKCP
jgi:hypothetical protein